MDLIPVTANAESSADAPERVILSERAKALARLRTTTVRRRSGASAELQLLGRIEPNETTLRTITAWTGGRIDRLFVNVTGQSVWAGQPIATLYSPEVFAAHQDLLVAKRQVERLASSPESTRQAVRAALDAARERLRLLGVPDDELTRMETQTEPTRAVSIRTPFGGTVIERLATEGAYVATGAPLYRIANLKKLWVQLDAYESDLSRLSKGQTVRVSVDALPGEEFEGQVTFIDPTLDKAKRTARVRVEIDNADGRIRPGMFAEATVDTGDTVKEASKKKGTAKAQEAAKSEQEKEGPLVIPATAPLFTGRRALVYVELLSDGRTAYEPRTVRLGPRLGEFYPVVAGLSEGERIVTRGAFVLDADLQIRGGPSMMTADPNDESALKVPIVLPPSELGKLGPVVSSYIHVQEALAADDLSAATRQERRRRRHHRRVAGQIRHRRHLPAAR
jgi:Cu(I)/Ag(I) efflux system membrane fusion protein